MTREDLSFVFHISKPNNEDVEPVIYNNWLAVADGMGGAGCMKHVVDKKFSHSLAAVLSYVLPEYATKINDPRYQALRYYIYGDNSGRPSYFSSIFESCINEDCNTSAHWASRIVMARFLYYVIKADAEGSSVVNEKEYFDGLAAFINKGLVDTKKRLELTVSNPDMSVLPTTCVAAHYSDLNEEECIVHSVWAGDSRCYVLSSNGLQKLTLDDEDESKLLTNHFSADMAAELHYRVYRLRKPFILIGASDGFFDAYDKSNLTVEARLLLDIFNSSSVEELYSALVERYDKNLSDDTSVAFVPVGFSGYEHIKNILTDRFNKINDLYSRHKEYAPIVALIDKPEHIVTTSICDRFESRFGEIIKALVEVYFSSQEDLLLTQWWKDTIMQCHNECENELAMQKKTRREKLKEHILECITSQPYSDCFKKKIRLNGGISSIILNFHDLSENLEKLRSKRNIFELRSESFRKELKEILEEVWREQEQLIAQLNESLLLSANMWDNELQAINANKNRQHITYSMNLLSRIESFSLSGDLNISEKEYNGTYKKLIHKSENFRERRVKHNNEVKDLENKIHEAERNINGCLKKIKTHIDRILELRHEIFTNDFISKFGMDNIINGVVAKEDIESLVASKLVARYAKDDNVIQYSLNLYKSNPSSVSCVDRIFPTAKLCDFRTYYLNKDRAQSAEFVQYRKDLDDYEHDVERLLIDG